VDVERHDVVATDAPGANSIGVPYVEAAFKISTRQEVHAVPASDLAEVVVQIIEVEGPIHGDELVRRVASLWGLKRAGNRIEESVRRALAEAARRGLVKSTGPFYRLAAQTVVPVRDRSAAASPHLL
jgi:hypothetical protein